MGQGVNHKFVVEFVDKQGEGARVTHVMIQLET